MKNIIYIVLIGLTSINASNGQQLIEGQGQASASPRNMLINTTPIVLNETVNGSPYSNEKFLPAKISASPDNIFYVRYNAEKDEIEVKGDNNLAYALNKNRKDIQVEVLTPKTTYQLYEYLDENNHPTLGYFIKLNVNENVLLLKKERKSFVGERTATTGYDTAKSAYYKKGKDTFFIKLNSEKASLEVPKNKKDFADLFPNNSAKVLAFIKENKLKTNNEKDLVTLVKFVNTF